LLFMFVCIAFPFFTFFFHLCLSIFWLIWISSLTYRNLLGTQNFGW
jgi:hypothetical protein